MKKISFWSVMSLLGFANEWIMNYQKKGYADVDDLVAAGKVLLEFVGIPIKVKF